MFPHICLEYLILNYVCLTPVQSYEGRLRGFHDMNCLENLVASLEICNRCLWSCACVLCLFVYLLNSFSKTWCTSFTAKLWVISCSGFHKVSPCHKSDLKPKATWQVFHYPVPLLLRRGKVSIILFSLLPRQRPSKTMIPTHMPASASPVIQCGEKPGSRGWMMGESQQLKAENRS